MSLQIRGRAEALVTNVAPKVKRKGKERSSKEDSLLVWLFARVH